MIVPARKAFTMNGYASIWRTSSTMFQFISGVEFESVENMACTSERAGWCERLEPRAGRRLLVVHPKLIRLQRVFHRGA
jgi:hypothetical protein